MWNYCSSLLSQFHKQKIICRFKIIRGCSSLLSQFHKQKIIYRFKIIRGWVWVANFCEWFVWVFLWFCRDFLDYCCSWWWWWWCCFEFWKFSNVCWVLVLGFGFGFYFSFRVCTEDLNQQPESRKFCLPYQLKAGLDEQRRIVFLQPSTHLFISTSIQMARAELFSSYRLHSSKGALSSLVN